MAKNEIGLTYQHTNIPQPNKNIIYILLRLEENVKSHYGTPLDSSECY